MYGGYAESNRAPTASELSCSSPESPCSLANFFTGDPDLKQVVAHTFEVGLRGRLTPYPKARLDWNISAYQTNLGNDITFVQSEVLGRGFFQNIGDTRREGIDAGLKFTSGRWTAYSKLFLYQRHLPVRFHRIERAQSRRRCERGHPHPPG